MKRDGNTKARAWFVALLTVACVAPVGSGSEWAQTELSVTGVGTDDYFSKCIDSYGDYLVVGASESMDSGTGGAAYIFKANDDGTWEQMANLTASDGVTEDYFGHSCAMHGTTVVIGAYLRDETATSSGAVYVFKKVDDSEEWTQVQKLLASDGGSYGYFGRSVALHEDWAVIGAATKAYFFKRDSEDSWAETQSVTASDAAPNDYFGKNVAMYGKYAVVGAHGNDIKGSSAGSAYVFLRNGDSWSQTQQLFASDASAGDRLGRGTAMSGTVMVLGADGVGDTGVAIVFSLSESTWTETDILIPANATGGSNFGYSVAVFDDMAVCGGFYDGYAWVFDSNADGSWTENARLGSDVDDSFGISVALSDNWLFVGAPSASTYGSDSGTAFAYSVPTSSPTYAMSPTYCLLQSD